ncbi:MAG: HEAT repeat domain-containing protein [bacterium]
MLLWATAGVPPTAAEDAARPRGRSTEDLIEDLGRIDPRARQSAARALGNVGDRGLPAVPALAAALTDEDHGVRLEAARTLRALAPDTRAAIPALTRALDDHFSDVQIESAYALGAIGPEAREAVPALIHALGDRQARMAAAWALGNIGSAARDALVVLERLRDGESDPKKRSELEWAIERVRWRKPARGDGAER